MRRIVMRRDRRRFIAALLISTLIHALLFTLQLDVRGRALPGLDLLKLEQRSAGQELNVVLAAPKSAAASAPAAVRTPAQKPAARSQPKSAPTKHARPKAEQAQRAKPKVTNPQLVAAAPPITRPPATSSTFVAVTETKPARTPKSPPARRTPKAAPRKKVSPKPPQPTIIAQELPLRKTFPVPTPAPESSSDAANPVVTEAPAVTENPETPNPNDAAQAQAEEAAALALAEALHKAEEQAAQAREQEAQRQEALRLQELEALKQEAARQQALLLEKQQEEKLAEQQAQLQIEKQTAELAAQQAQQLAALEAREQEAQQEAQRAAQEAAQREEAQRAEEAAQREEAQRQALENEARMQAEESARQQAQALERAEQLAAAQAAGQAAAAAAAAARQGERSSNAGDSRATDARERAADQKPSDKTTSGAAGSDPATRAPVSARNIDPRPSQRPAAPTRIARSGDKCRQKAEGWYKADLQVDIYAATWRNMVRVNAPFNLLQDAKTGAYENPVVTVAINSDGSVKSITFNKSSGLPELDNAVRRIIQMLAPYTPFEPQLEVDCDFIEFPSIWNINRALRLSWRGQ